MSLKRYADDFKTEAVRQVVEYGRPVTEVAQRLDVSIQACTAADASEATATWWVVCKATGVRKCAA